MANVLFLKKKTIAINCTGFLHGLLKINLVKIHIY